MASGKSTKNRGKSQAVKNATAKARQAKAHAKDLARKQRRNFKEHVKRMRPYLKKLRTIDLREKPSSKDKSFVTRAYHEFTKLNTRPVKVYRAKKDLADIQMLSGHKKGGVKFDVAFVPAASPKAKVKIRRDKKTGAKVLEVKLGPVIQSTVYWDVEELTRDSEATVKKALAEVPNAQLISIMADEYIMEGASSPSLVHDKVYDLMMKYTQEFKRPNESVAGHHYYEHWLFGIRAFQNHDVETVNKYRVQYNKDAGLAKAKAAALRRKDNAPVAQRRSSGTDSQPIIKRRRGGLPGRHPKG